METHKLTRTCSDVYSPVHGRIAGRVCEHYVTVSDVRV